MSRMTTGLRLGIGAIVSVAAAAAVAGGSLVPWPQTSAAAPAVEVAPEAAETLLACDGPLLAIGRAAEAAGEITVAGDMRTVAANAHGEEPAVDELAFADVPDTSAELLRQSPDGAAPVAVAGAASAEIDATDMAGFAASACRAPQMDSWIVGGDTSTGSTGILLVANPTDVNAVVSLEVYGIDGRTVPPGFESLTIPARTQVPIPLAGIAGAETGPVVRVTATGAPVRTTLQSSIVRTLDPGGIDLQAAVTPSTMQTIPGITVIEEAGGESESSTGQLRLLATADTEAAVTVVSSEGEVVRDAEPVSVVADEPIAVDLGSLDEGRYSVTVTADEPLVAAAWQATGLGPGSDYAWYPATAEVSDEVLVAVPGGPRPTLHLAGAGEDAAVAVVHDGEESVIEVPASGYVETRLPGEGAYTIDPGGTPVHASIGFADVGKLGVFGVEPDPSAPQPVTVLP